MINMEPETSISIARARLTLVFSAISCVQNNSAQYWAPVGTIENLPTLSDATLAKQFPLAVVNVPSGEHSGTPIKALSFCSLTNRRDQSES